MRALLLLLLLLTAVACGEDVLDPSGDFAGLSLEPDSLGLGIGASVRLEATLPDGSDALENAILTWVSTDPTVATVDAGGRVTAVSLGTAVVSATVAGVTARAIVRTGLTFIALAAGRAHTCGLLPTGSIWCWGDGTEGQLGNARRTIERLPTRVQSDVAFVRIASGWNHTCAIAVDGDAWCWGRGGLGQRGDGSNRSIVDTPSRVVNDFRWQQLSAGIDHTCGITVDAELACWGGNADGQLGIGTTSPRLGPFPIGGLAPMAQVSAGLNHSCATDVDGGAWCWGANDFGQLGIDTVPTSIRTSPQQILPTVPMRSVLAARGSYTCALTRTAAAWCWGRADDGQLGRDTTPPLQAVPGAVADTAGFSNLAPGVFHTCGTGIDGIVRCWGTSRLGAPGLTASATPNALGTPAAVSQVVTGVLHTCALTPAGEAWCWGGNEFGELGNGDNVPSDVPVRVALQP